MQCVLDGQVVFLFSQPSHRSHPFSATVLLFLHSKQIDRQRLQLKVWRKETVLYIVNKNSISE